MNLSTITGAISAFFKGVINFVKGAAPIAEAVGAATGNPEVVAAAKLAEVAAAGAEAAGKTIADRSAKPGDPASVDTGHRARLADE